MDFSKNQIHFHYLISPFYFPDRSETKKFIAKIFQDHNRRINAINYIFCADEYLLSINQAYLKHDYYTDIITFDLSYDKFITADVFISFDRVKANAITYKVSRLSEIRRLLIHGALHLCGYKDKTPNQFKRMKEMEELYLNEFMVSRETN